METYLIPALILGGCGVLAGARVPVAITSRSDSAEKAYLSLAACAALVKDGVYEN